MIYLIVYLVGSVTSVACIIFDSYKTGHDMQVKDLGSLFIFFVLSWVGLLARVYHEKKDSVLLKGKKQ